MISTLLSSPDSSRDATHSHHHRGLSRPAVVFLIVIAGLSITAGVLWVLSPNPLSPDTILNLSAVGETRQPAEPGQLANQIADQIFERLHVRPRAWTHIAVRLSGAPSGNAASLAEVAATRGGRGPPDHFVICNGNGGEDGAIEVTSRWRDQLSGSTASSPDSAQTIRIALVGDAARGGPTRAQMARLSQLLAALQGRLKIPAARIVVPPPN